MPAPSQPVTVHLRALSKCGQIGSSGLEQYDWERPSSSSGRYSGRSLKVNAATLIESKAGGFCAGLSGCTAAFDRQLNFGSPQRNTWAILGYSGFKSLSAICRASPSRDSRRGAESAGPSDPPPGREPGRRSRRFPPQPGPTRPAGSAPVAACPTPAVRQPIPESWSGAVQLALTAVQTSVDTLRQLRASGCLADSDRFLAIGLECSRQMCCGWCLWSFCDWYSCGDPRHMACT